MTEPVWWSVEDVLDIAETLAAETGAPFEIRDADRLAAAVRAPQASWATDGVEDVVELAVILGVAIARNHPFVHANRQAGWLSMLGFLHMNGCSLENQDHEYYGALFTDLITGEQDMDTLLVQLRVSQFD